jgi:3-keto-5-aminohexanoate cleavage enzyme
MSDRVLISCALTGAVTTKQQCAAIPYTAVEMGEEARRAYEAGAAVVHVHGREDDGRPSYRPEVFAAYLREIRARSPVIVNFSTGAVGLSKEDRIAHITATRPEIAALNMGSMNYAKYSAKRKQFVFQFVFQNPFDEIIYYLEQMTAASVRPECEVFDTGHAASLLPLIDMGLLRPPIDVNLVMGVMGGMPADPDMLAFLSRRLPPGCVWKTTPVSHNTWSMTAAALALGGNVRVGLEDNFYLPGGAMVASNGELCAQAVAMARSVGREPMPVDEARAVLGLGR